MWATWMALVAMLSSMLMIVAPRSQSTGDLGYLQTAPGPSLPSEPVDQPGSEIVSPWELPTPPAADDDWLQDLSQQSSDTPDLPGDHPVYFPLVSKKGVHYVTLPTGFNAGGADLTTRDGRRYRRDVPYSLDNGAGYVDGRAVSANTEVDVIEATVDERLYRSGRTGMTAYRFDVPNGDYLVELDFAEIVYHAPQFRVFDVRIEDETLIDSLDLYELVQHDYAVRYRFPARVRDRQLTIAFDAAVSEPILAAIWVARRDRDTQPPAKPAEIRAVGGYGENILYWPPVAGDDVAGYRVYRALSLAGPFQLITPVTTPAARLFDNQVVAATRYCYQVTAVDAFGNESTRSSIACATSVTAAAAMLPVIDLWVSPQDLRQLNSNPYANEYVPASMDLEGRRYSVDVRYRGNISRACNKKSWRIKAGEILPFAAQDTLLLNSQCFDATLMKDKVAYEMFTVLGMKPVQARYVHVNLNTRFAGVYTLIENLDERFLARTERNPMGDLFRCYDPLSTQPACTNETREGRGLEDLYEFAALVNRTPDQEFDSAIRQALDVRAYLDYLAVKTLISDTDAVSQYLLYHDPVSQRWEVLPWDNNVSFFGVQLPINFGTAEQPDYWGRHNILMTRVLDVPQYRRYFGDQLLRLSRGLFSPDNMKASFDVAEAAIWADLQRDTWKLYREQNDRVHGAINLLDVFATNRASYIQTAVPGYVPRQSVYVYLNELVSHSRTSLLDPADGQPEPWFEIYNAGLEPVNLGGMYLSNDPGNPARYRIPNNTIVPALSATVFWADGEPAQGAQHTSFTLSRSGGQLSLVDADGRTQVDRVAYPALGVDVAFGRFPDATGAWIPLPQPMPGQSNRLLPPSIYNVEHTPAYPQAGEPVTVSAQIVDDTGVASALLQVTIDASTTSIPLMDDGNHGDGEAGDGKYGAFVPPQAQSTRVKYYLSAVDLHNRQSLAPAAAPVLTFDYLVGYQPPTVTINEFMAANATVIEDPDEPGEYPDWIELHNHGAAPVDLQGFYLTDDPSLPRRFRIDASVVVLPGQSVIFWADDDPSQGPRHTNLKLQAGGEWIGLFHPDGHSLIDEKEFGPQATDISTGRCPDAQGGWQPAHFPSPGQANQCNRQYLPVVQLP